MVYRLWDALNVCVVGFCGIYFWGSQVWPLIRTLGVGAVVGGNGLNGLKNLNKKVRDKKLSLTNCQKIFFYFLFLQASSTFLISLNVFVIYFAVLSLICDPATLCKV